MPQAIVAAGIAATGAVAGGVIASSAAKKASKVQAQAARDAQTAQERMYQQQTQLQEPFRQAGIAAQSRIMELLGLGPAPGANGQSPSAYGLKEVTIPSYLGGEPSTFYVDKDGNIVSDVNAYMAEHPSAAPQTPPSADFGKYARDFSMADFQADPGYAFRQSEGMKALERSAAARGGLLSGGMMKGIQRFGQDLASQEYQNAFNRYQVNRANQLNPLQSLMGAGQSATNMLTGAAAAQGQNQAANIMNAAQARASGYIGSANALSSALSGVGQAAMQYPLYSAQTNYLNTLAGGGGSFGGGYSPSAALSYTTPSLSNTIASAYPSATYGQSLLGR